jgi:HEXXH motif-containing protein
MSTSLEPLLDLTVPAPGASTARRVLSAWLADLVASLGRLPLAHASPAVRADVAGALRVVRALLQREPGAVLGALRRTTVSAHLRAALALGPRPETALVDRLLLPGIANLLGELAAARVAFDPITLARPPHRLLLRGPELALEIPRAARSLRFEPGAITIDDVRVDLAALPPDADRPWHPLAPSIALALADDNPLAMDEAHPDKHGNALSLGGRPLVEWSRALEDALARIATYLPEIRDEMTLALGQVVPVGWDAEKHLSATYREAIGTIYLTLHPDPMTMTEAIVHEHQHTKLNALAALDPLLENAFSPLYASPVRPDPRPLHGVLLALHAFVPNALLYARMRAARDPLCDTPRFAARHAEIVANDRAALDVLLAHARPTPHGSALLRELHDWQRRCEADLAAG